MILVPLLKRVIWFYPKIVEDDPTDETKVFVTDTENKIHQMTKTDALLKAYVNKDVDYIDIDETNFIPVYWFRMWYTMF